MRHVLWGLMMSALLSACATENKYAPPKVVPQPIERTDVIGLITGGKETGVPTPSLSEDDFRKAFDKALREASPTKLERNRIQDRLILASNVLCDDYKNGLKHVQSGWNFRLGAASTIAGALGATAVGAQAAKNLAAVSGAVTGIRAEFNEDYFSQMASHVISRGITVRRDNIIQKIMQTRDQDLDKYTLEGAISDAVTYHSACTLISGLEQAAASVENTKDRVGIDALFATPGVKAPGTEGK
jgi:hypothetical protein